MLVSFSAFNDRIRVFLGTLEGVTHRLKTFGARSFTNGLNQHSRCCPGALCRPDLIYPTRICVVELFGRILCDPACRVNSLPIAGEGVVLLISEARLILAQADRISL
jgi:hypothetical protein